MADLFSIAGKTALVTGGGQGIGRMISQGFVEAGARVFIASRKADVLDAAAAELRAAVPDADVTTFTADLSTHDGCKALAEQVSEAAGGSLDILVNNSGANWGAPFEEFPDAAWDRCLDTNVKGVFHLTRYLTPALEAAGTHDDPSRVINIGSIDGLRTPELDTWAYSASKAAVHHLTRTLARTLAPKHITVNAVAPGPFQSKMMAATLDAFGDAIAASTPLKRIGTPEDMAGVTIFLSSRAGAYLTGTVIPVDGGMSQLR
jgi:NAD(P)-dependent dehydrogenase (short-subunit alcohol dehydrogenase family)